MCAPKPFLEIESHAFNTTVSKSIFYSIFTTRKLCLLAHVARGFTATRSCKPSTQVGFRITFFNISHHSFSNKYISAASHNLSKTETHKAMHFHINKES